MRTASKGHKSKPGNYFYFQKYFQKHFDLIKHSFSDVKSFKLMLVDIGFMITLMLSYALIYYFWIRNILSLSYLTDVISLAQASDLSSSQIVSAWASFVTTTILVLLLALLLYLIMMSVYGSISHAILAKNRISAKLLVNSLAVNGILIITYLIIIVAMFYLSDDVLLIAWGLIVTTILYLYMALIFYLTANDSTIWSILKHGLKASCRLHDTLLPIILALILSSFVILIIIIIGIAVPLLTIITILYAVNWMKVYLHHIIHE